MTLCQPCLLGRRRCRPSSITTNTGGGMPSSAGTSTLQASCSAASDPSTSSATSALGTSSGPSAPITNCLRPGPMAPVERQRHVRRVELNPASAANNINIIPGRASPTPSPHASARQRAVILLTLNIGRLSGLLGLVVSAWEEGGRGRVVGVFQACATRSHTSKPKEAATAHRFPKRLLASTLPHSLTRRTSNPYYYLPGRCAIGGRGRCDGELKDRLRKWARCRGGCRWSGCALLLVNLCLTPLSNVCVCASILTPPFPPFAAQPNTTTTTRQA